MYMYMYMYIVYVHVFFTELQVYNTRCMYMHVLHAYVVCNFWLLTQPQILVHFNIPCVP